MSGISRHCPACGGAMAEDKQDVEDSKANDPECRELELRRLDLEIGPGGFRSWLREQVLKVIFDNLPQKDEGSRLNALKQSDG